MTSPKHLAKRVCATAVEAARRGGGERSVVLCYHSIHPERPFRSLTPEAFREHLAWLVENTDVVRLDELRRERANGRPRVAITFDDGYEDNWTHAFPLLEERRLPATFFVTVGLLDRDPAVVDRFASTLRRCPRDDVVPMGWEQVRELRDAGHEIGGHTYSHPNLARLGEEDVRRELSSSKQILEERLEAPVVSVAYPFGKPRRHVSAATVEAAGEAGYERGVAVITRAVRASDSELSLPRLTVAGDDIATLRQKVTGAWDFMGWWQERAPLWAVKAVRPGDAGF